MQSRDGVRDCQLLAIGREPAGHLRSFIRPLNRKPRRRLVVDLLPQRCSAGCSADDVSASIAALMCCGIGMMLDYWGTNKLSVRGRSGNTVRV